MSPQVTRNKSFPVYKSYVGNFISLILLGLVFVISGGYVQLYQSLSTPAVAQAATIYFNKMAIIPSRLTIGTAGVDVTIKEGGIVEGQWVLDDNQALFFPLESSVRSSSLVIYGHNTMKLFGNLKLAKIGDTISVTDNKGLTHLYQIYSKEVIDPNQVDKLVVPADNQLVMFTCDGWFDSQRLLLKARSVTSNEPGQNREN